MAISEQQRQKKLAKKKQKRASASKSVFKPSMAKAKPYANHPIYECLKPLDMFEIGIGELIVTRRLPDGIFAMSAFVIDVFCLGVKDAMFKILTEDEYEALKDKFSEGRAFEKLHLTCAKKLLDGAVAYAKDLGFNPHPDYNNAKDLFGDIDGSLCLESYSYGKDGKPLYINGPYESQVKIQKIIDTLHKKCGEGGFDFVTQLTDMDDDF